MRRASLIAATCALISGCGDVDTGPNIAASLEFSALPYPAVVAGDTLRDANGVAAPLRALVYNSDNEQILAATVEFTGLESVVTVNPVTGIVVAGSVADTSVRIVASVGGLQATPLRLSVVPRPDSIYRSQAIDTLRYSVSDSTQNLSGEIAVKVVNRSGTAELPVRDWIVTFSLQTPSDSSRARIVGANERPSTSDTTSSTGIASRRIRLYPALLASARDSVIVLARARYRGSDLKGSPVRLVVPVQPRVQ